MFGSEIPKASSEVETSIASARKENPIAQDQSQTTRMNMDSSEDKGESTVFSVSIRAWVMLFVLFAVIAISALDAGTTAWMIYTGKLGESPGYWIKEPLYGLAYMVIGYYFGKQGQKQTTNGTS